jgi:hypothetical protein
VKYGALAMADAAIREAAAPPPPIRTQRTSGIIETAKGNDKSKFWEWIKAAF